MLSFRLPRRTALAGAVLVLAACDGSSAADRDGGAPPDSGTTPTAELVLLGDPSIALLFGEEAEVRVFYREATDGTPIPREEISFALVGRANDSTLSSLSARTDSNGEAVVRVVAGRSASTFRVRASAARAASVSLDVAVSDAGFGSLRAAVEFDGARPVATRRVSLFSGATCDTPELDSAMADRARTLGAAEDTTELLALPAGLSYAVLAEGLAEGGAVVARGCVDDVTIVSDDTVEVVVPILDLPLRIEGSYTIDVALEPAGLSLELGRAVQRGGRGMVEAAGGDASFLLDAIEAHLRAAGSTAAADAIASERASAFLDDALAARLEGAGLGPARAVDTYADELSRRTARIVVTGAATAGATSVFESFEVRQLGARDEAAAEPPLLVDLGAITIDTAGVLDARWLDGADALDLRELGVILPLGTVGIGVARALATEDGFDTPAAALTSLVGCDELADWALGIRIIDSVCDSACTLAACTTAFEAVMTAAGDELLGLDGMRSDVSLAGRVEVRDEPSDLRIDGLEAADLAGAWRAPGGVAGDEIRATLTGSRMLE